MHVQIALIWFRLHSKQACQKTITLLLPIASFKEEALEKVSSLNAVEDLDVEAYLQSELSSAVSIHETSLIDKQTKLYEEWNLQRDAELQKQMELYQVKL